MALTQVKSDGIATGAVTAEQIATGAVTANDLEDSGVTAGTYGSSSAIPAITVDAKGRITSASTSSIDSTAITNGTSNVSVAASGDITATRAGTQRLAVNGAGINVTGTVTCDGITSDGSINIESGTGQLNIKDTNNTGNGALCELNFKDSNNATLGYLGYANTSNSTYYIHNAQNDSILFGTNNQVRVEINNSGHVLPATNNAYDLGTSSQRWRNLYTNGVLFNGDTAATNRLDDYEEGVWTPQFEYLSGGSFFNVSFTSSPTYGTGSYVKIGNVVYFSYFSGAFDINSGTGAPSRISGLPYSSYNDQGTYSGAIFYHTTCFSPAINSGFINIGTTHIYPVINNATTQPAWDGSANRYLMVSGTYRTT